MLSIEGLIDDAKCFEAVREFRWADGVKCPHCGSDHITKQGFRKKQPDRQRYLCKSCYYPFDDLSETIFAGHHQPLRIWMLCLYFMGLNQSNLQIAQELNLNKDDVQAMTTQLRTGIVKKKPVVTLQDNVECDEVYVVAGHKGNPVAVREKGRDGRRNRLKGSRGRGTLAKEKPPIFIQQIPALIIAGYLMRPKQALHITSAFVLLHSLLILQKGGALHKKN